MTPETKEALEVIMPVGAFVAFCIFETLQVLIFSILIYNVTNNK